MGVNESLAAVKDSCRPVTKGFVKYQHLSVQLVQKKMDRNAKLRLNADADSYRFDFSICSLDMCPQKGVPSEIHDHLFFHFSFFTFE